ncbi:MAG TPA: hypothetical protein H9867_08470 [Candidatus Corynebacterium gallistercoris]|uniref:Prepilin peptidase n=1 Tax=Candidatus Corynebacterium gallistercoris TaxID=2838530 RepID=A0A9D1UR05_9CORY|nr:hypothetical protein [Candidatus Corynebacterium gallistercoris]
MVVGGIALVVWAGVVVWCDVTTRHIPNALSVVGATASVAVAFVKGDYAALAAGAAWWLWAVCAGLLHPRARAGGADAKVGITIGVVSTLAHPAGAFVALGAAGMCHALAQGWGRWGGGGVATKETMPHAPAMMAGLATATAWGQLVG